MERRQWALSSESIHAHQSKSRLPGRCMPLYSIVTMTICFWSGTRSGPIPSWKYLCGKHVPEHHTDATLEGWRGWRTHVPHVRCLVYILLEVWLCLGQRGVPLHRSWEVSLGREILALMGVPIHRLKLRSCSENAPCSPKEAFACSVRFCTRLAGTLWR